jgi:hypothetical protein
MKIRCTLAALAAGCFVTCASAGTVTAQYTGLYGASATVDQDSIFLGNVNTATFQWTRTDSPGPGVDSTLSSPFRGYCVEIVQTVSPNTSYTYNVVSAAAHGYSGMQEMLLGRLFASFEASVNNPTSSAAFQLAVWELSFDVGADLSTGDFDASAPLASITLAQGWLNTITSGSYSGGQAPISVLEHPTAQDQVVPAPGSLALLALGGGLAIRRKRK